jgi:RNA polymerase sigma factor (sigma-70 family)
VYHFGRNPAGKKVDAPGLLWDHIKCSLDPSSEHPMAGTRHPSILHYLRRVLGDPSAAGVSDADLLRRFVDHRDEAAFELLLWRHAAMVLHVCRQVLGEEQTAEDAFQATFLVLVRKAGSISRREALGSWLYRVAHRIAFKALAERRKRISLEGNLEDRDLPVPTDCTEKREQGRIIAEEVHHLPAKYRAAIIACYFESKTLEEAAQQLGWPRGTVASRLARGRELLRRRLIRRGVTLTAAMLSTYLSVQTSAAGLTNLISVTLRTIKLFTASSAIPPSIAALAQGVIQAMYWTRVKIVMIVLLLAVFGTMGTAYWTAAPRPTDSPKESAPPAAANRGRDKEKPEDAAKLARDMAQSRLNLRKLAIAMLTYVDVNKGHLPPPALINKDGKAVLSWRVLLLPYLGEQELYHQFKLSEPWDGPHNKKLLSKMPAVYAPPGVKTPQPYSTFYQVFVSPKPEDGHKAAEKGGSEIQAAFVQGESQIFPAHFPDGVSNTILIVEAGNAVPWTKPEDLPYEVNNIPGLPELGGLFPDVFHAAFADGVVLALTKKYNEFNLRRFITSNDGQIHYYAQVMARSAAAELRSKNRELQEDLDYARDRLRLLQEERDALQGKAGGAKGKQEPESRLDELKQENVRLQKELEKMRENIRRLNAEVLQRLHKSS